MNCIQASLRLAFTLSLIAVCVAAAPTALAQDAYPSKPIRIIVGAAPGGGIDRILRGANPRSPPIEQPTKYDFAINLKTAKAMGLTVSPSLLLRADEVIQ